MANLTFGCSAHTRRIRPKNVPLQLVHKMQDNGRLHTHCSGMHSSGSVTASFSLGFN